MADDTICAIATPLGTGGVSIIRISGNKSLHILKNIFDFQGKQPRAREMYFGKLQFNGFNDNALCVFFPKPNSFTGEDVAELHLHGGYYITNSVLNQIIAMGTRLAEPGEFSRRAVLNGKMDLTQAEAIIDLINANSQTELRASSEAMNGALREKIQAIQNDLTNLICQVDVAIDYPDQDIEYITHQQIQDLLVPIQQKVIRLLDTCATGNLVKNGVTVALYGIPNAGKSSLLNALLGWDRAIVTNIAGTTRDTLSESYEWRGIRFNIFDTAGIRESNDIVEKEGIKRARQLTNQADLIIQLFDATQDYESQNSNLKITGNIIKVLNKIDSPLDKSLIDKTKNFDLLISAKNHTRIIELKDLIFNKTINSTKLNEKVLITNARHKQALEQTVTIFTDVMQAITSKNTIDCIALLLRNAWLQLGTITGDNTDQTIIDMIFSKFCLGK